MNCRQLRAFKKAIREDVMILKDGSGVMKRAMGGAMLFPMLLSMAVHAETLAPLPSVRALLDDTEAAYGAHRARMLEDAATIQALKTKAKSLTFSDASWKEDVVIDILASRVTHPRSFPETLMIEGLHPRQYLQRRRPEPSASGELARASYHPTVLLETYMFGRATYPFSPRDEYKGKSDVEFTTLRELEEEALEGALLAAIAQSGHQAAFHVLKDAAFTSTHQRLRMLSISLMGYVSGERAHTFLESLFLSSKWSVEARRAAAIGLGRQRTPAATNLLLQYLDSSQHIDYRQTIVHALGHAGTRSLRQNQTDAGQRMRARISASLLRMVAQENDPDTLRSVAESVVRVQSSDLENRLADFKAAHPGLNERQLNALQSIERRLRYQRHRQR